MYSRILVPLDGSSLSTQALPYARLLGSALNTQIELFRVVPTLADIVRGMSMRRYEAMDDIEATWPQGSFEQWEELHRRMRQEAEEDLEAAASTMRSVSPKVLTKLSEGDPAEAIADEAERQDDTLIVMTTHGRSGLSRWWIGSVTDRTLHLTASPAFVVRCQDEAVAPPEPALRNIILPLDGSTLAEQSVPHAAALARGLNARIDLLQAVKDSRFVPVRQPIPEALPPEQHTGANEYLSGIVDRLRDEGVVNVEMVTTEADAADAITDMVEGAPESMVVMSTHGRSGLQRALMGSVADKVVRHSGRPVLLIRCREEVPAAAEPQAA